MMNESKSREEKKLKRATRRAEKKRKKKEKFQAKSRAGKIWFYLWRILLCVVAISILVIGIFFLSWYSKYNSKMELFLSLSVDYEQYPREEILSITPMDLEGETKINAVPTGSKDDTWAIYIYMCGSDLESVNNIEISSFAYETSRRIYNDNINKNYEMMTSRVNTFMDTIDAEGLDMPASLYRDIYAYEDTNSVPDPEAMGAASADITEILSATMGPNVKILLETGGSARWYNPNINPNFNERFIYDENGFRKIESHTMSSMGNQKTLEDFFEFCKQYPADHQILLFWDHGCGYQGFCQDENFNERILLPDLRSAFENVYGKKPTKYPFDLIGFDACLMAQSEVLEYINGYCKYLVASEEIEPGWGWFYTPWINDLNEDPSMSPAKVAQNITDSYVEFYANQDLEFDEFGMRNSVTMSVIDVDEYEMVSDAYNKLITRALQDVSKEASIMSEISKASISSIRFAENNCSIYNLIDLGTFMEQVQEIYPTEAKCVLDNMEKAILYKRGNRELADATGVAVYFPTQIENCSGLKLFLLYVDEVCLHPEQKAFFFYKVAGCLNDEIKTFMKNEGYGNLKNVNTKVLQQLPNSQMQLLENGNFTFQMENISDLIQAYDYCLAKYDEKAQMVTYYGRDNYVLEEEGLVQSTFDGTWLTMDGVVLPTQIIGYTTNSIRYRVPVLMDNTEYYLIISCDINTNACEIVGLNLDNEYDLIGRDLLYLGDGDKFYPIYEVNYLSSPRETKNLYKETKKAIKYHHDMKIERKIVADGKYYAYVELTDTRSDIYSTPVVELTIRDGKIKEVVQCDDLYNDTY